MPDSGDSTLHPSPHHHLMLTLSPTISPSTLHATSPQISTEVEQLEVQIHHPKKLLDLPNEIIDRICDYLVPTEHQPRVVELQHAWSSTYDIVTGWQDVNPACGLQESLQTDHNIYREMRESVGNLGRSDRWVHVKTKLTSPSTALPRHQWGSDLGAFAATCKQFSQRATSILDRRTFQLTVSNGGIAFEGFQSEKPFQAFMIPGGYAAINPKTMTIATIIDGTVPGNHAFKVFSRLVSKVKALRIHVETDMDWRQTKRTVMFLHQISKFLMSLSAKDIKLPIIEVTLNMDFHHSNKADQRLTFTRFGEVTTMRLHPRHLPAKVVEDMRKRDLIKPTVIDTVVPNLIPVLSKLLSTMLKIRNEQIELRARADTPGSNALHPYDVRILIQGDFSAGNRWGKFVGGRRQSSPGQSAPTVEHGSFEEFCRLLQQRLYPSKRVAENQLNEKLRRCRLGFPLSSKTIKLSIPKRKNEDEHDGGSEKDHGDESGHLTKRQKVS